MQEALFDHRFANSVASPALEFMEGEVWQKAARYLRLQDGYFVWNIFKLGTWRDLLAVEDDVTIISKNVL